MKKQEQALTTTVAGRALPRRVLLVGGVSGTGKSTVARQLGLRFGAPWLHVDDLRLAIQHSRARLPEHNEALYLFTDYPQVWRRPAEELRDGLIAVGTAMSPAVEIVTLHHIDHADPAILEGDGIVPAIVERPLLRPRFARKQVGLVFLVEPDEEALLANMLARGRGIDDRSAEENRTEARMKWLFGHWLTAEAQRRGLPVLEPRPWETLADRILATMD